MASRHQRPEHSTITPEALVSTLGAVFVEYSIGFYVSSLCLRDGASHTRNEIHVSRTQKPVRKSDFSSFQFMQSFSPPSVCNARHAARARSNITL